MRQSAQIEVAGQVLKRPLAVADIFGVTYEILRHPSLLVPPHVKHWIEDYEYTKEYKIPVPFEERHPCWLDMRNEWEALQKGLGLDV